MHGRVECRHGTLVAQCRCMEHAVVEVVPCPSDCPQRGSGGGRVLPGADVVEHPGALEPVDDGAGQGEA
jgi:hypothetical protein